VTNFGDPTISRVPLWKKLAWKRDWGVSNVSLYVHQPNDTFPFTIISHGKETSEAMVRFPVNAEERSMIFVPVPEILRSASWIDPKFCILPLRERVQASQKSVAPGLTISPSTFTHP
jgi:hypothetical protein